MKIIISVPGRFHAFSLAEQLDKRGMLFKLITSYPKLVVKKFIQIPKNKISSVLVKEILQRGWEKVPNFLKNIYNPQFIISEMYDYLVSLKIKKVDMFLGWSSSSLYSLRRAKSLGVIGMIERGSSHIEYQREILKEEYERFGVKPVLPHKKIVEKELKEYVEADYIIIPSSFVRRTFLEKGVSENKLIQVPYGVDLSAFRQIIKKDDKFRVIFAGGMTLRKGVHYLLQAFAELDLPNSELLLLGSYNEEIRPFFEKYKDRFRWLGHIPQKELYKYYSQGSVFCLPSLEEGMAMVQAQAMACGLPLICTTNTGGEDLIREGVDGFTVPIRDVEKLKEKIKFLYDNPEICKEMGQSAKERVSSGFTWDDYGDKIVREYERIYRG